MRGHGRGRFGGQRRGRSMLRPTLLLLMHEGSTHGYDLLERLNAFGLADVSPSLIYRALRDMEEDGLVRSQWGDEQSQGPPRRIYTITSAGDEVLLEHMRDLKTTRQHINHLLEAYDQHMDKFHDQDKKGDK